MVTKEGVGPAYGVLRVGCMQLGDQPRGDQTTDSAVVHDHVSTRAAAEQRSVGFGERAAVAGHSPTALSRRAPVRRGEPARVLAPWEVGRATGRTQTSAGGSARPDRSRH